MNGLTRSLDRFLRTFWGTGAFTFVCGLLAISVFTLLGSVPTLAYPLTSIFIAASFANLTRTITLIRDETSAALTRSSMHANSTGDITSSMASLDRPFLAMLGVRVLQDVVTCFRELRGALDNEFLDQGAYMAFANPLLSTLKKGDMVLAVCGNKDWSSLPVVQFTEENLQAGKRGAHVERVFIQNAKRFPKGERETIRAHLAAEQGGALVRAWCVPFSSASQLRETHSLPNGFGMTYIQRGVVGSADHKQVMLVHWGLDDRDRRGLQIHSPVAIGAMLHVFASIRQSATQITGNETYMQ